MPAWFREGLLKEMTALCQRSVEAYYSEIGRRQGQRAPTYFLEKQSPNAIPAILWELYASTREVILVRDPRDMVASIRAFNTKRQTLEFGRARVATDEEHLLALGEDGGQLLASYRARQSRVRVVRYEDLILHPRETLKGMLDYLALDSSPEAVTALLHPARTDTLELEAHRTTATPAQSIGRWQRDLSPGTQALCRAVFGRFLEAIGYTDTGVT